MIDFKQVLKQCGESVKSYPHYLETGTGLGRSLEAAARASFVHMHSIELQPDRAKAAAVRLRAVLQFEELLNTDDRICLQKGRRRICIWIGNSIELFDRRLAENSGPMLVHLDAHFCRPARRSEPPASAGRFSLWHELKAILDREWADIVSVDDIHTFGRDRPDLGKADRHIWRNVTKQSLTEFMGDRIRKSFVHDDSLIFQLKGVKKWNA